MKYFISVLFSLLIFFAVDAKTTSSKENLSVEKVLLKGKYLKLSDKTFWQVEPDSIPLTGSWLFAPKVTIKKSNDPVFNYTMTNQTSKTKVLVKKISHNNISQKEISPPKKSALTPHYKKQKQKKSSSNLLK